MEPGEGESVHEWSSADRFRLRALLTNSILPLVLCMLGVLLVTITPPLAGIWRWCSGCAFVVFLLLAITMTKIFVRLDLPQIQRERATRFVFYLFGILGTAAIALLLYNTVFLGAFWRFFTSIIFQLVTAMFQFAHDPPAA
jgi:hypothetical protein